MLIVALGILTLLSVLALTFVSVMRLEAAASMNYVEGVRSRMIAEGGLELAMAQLKIRAAGEAFSDPNVDWNYANGNYWLPLEESSPVRRGSADDTIALNDVRASFAGNMGASYAGGLDQYKVKVVDTQTQFNLNSEFEIIDDLDHTYIRFLDALGVAISRLNPRARGGGTGGGRNPVLNARYPRGSPNAWRGGEAIYRFRISREGRRFNSKAELLEVLADAEDYKLLRDYVTTRSWFDPNTVQPASVSGLQNKPWSDVMRKEPRSPINVNLATTEVLAANLAGIAGRGIFLYTGDYDARDQRTQRIDAGTAFEFGAHREETQYGTTGLLVYISPFGFQPGAAQNDPPIVHGAIEVARLIKDRLRAEGPFRSYAEWEAWVDLRLTDSLIENTRDPDSGNFVFPRASDARILLLTELPLTGTPSDADVKRHPRFRAWFYDAVRAMLKANFNPNARTSSFNPDATAHLPVDKGGLLYFADPINPGSTVWQRQTLEWCFAPKGIFEITALGEVLGPPPADITKGTERQMFAQAKIMGILQLYETETHTTQRHFERNGYAFRAERELVSSQPVPRIYWDPQAEAAAQQQNLERGQGQFLAASDEEGYLQLATRTQMASGADPSMPPTYDTGVVDLGNRRFELLMQDRRIENPGTPMATHPDPLIADTSGGLRNNPNQGTPAQGRPVNGYGWPFGTARQGINPLTRSATAQQAWRWDVLRPDGYLNSELRPSHLWFRASDRNSQALTGQPDGRLRGHSFDNLTDGGNVAPTPRGGVELWYKPEFDWAIRQGVNGANLTDMPDQRFCGLLGTSHITQNMTAFQGGPSPALGSWTRGTQMFVTRNTSGELRITRMYFEVVGPNGHLQEEPLVEDPATPGTLIRFSEYYNRAGTNLAYVWPPKELLNIPPPWNNLKLARQDVWVPFQQLRPWRAHEWHHIAIWWDDFAPDIKVWLDGRPAPVVKRAPPLGPRYAPQVPNPAGQGPPVPAPQGNPPGPAELPAFVRLNHITGPTTSPSGVPQPQYEDSVWPKDQITIGSVRREQAAAGGLFKHFAGTREPLLPANGTVDDVRFFDGSRQPTTNVPAERFEIGEWANEFDLSERFPSTGGTLELASLSFTAYLPRAHAAQTFPNGAGSVVVEFRVVAAGQSWAAPKHQFPHWVAVFDNVRTGRCSIDLKDDAGAPIRIERTDRLMYRVEMAPASSANNYPIASPVLDDVSLVFRLPSPVVLLKERVND